MSSVWIIKIFCSFVLCMGGGYGGIVFSSRYDTRINQIRDFKTAFKSLSLEILMNNTVLCDALRYTADISQGVAKEVFYDFSESLKTAPGEDLYKLWCESLEKYKAELCLTKEELRTMKDFSINLGKGCREEEAGNINKTVLRLELAEDNAMEKKSKNSKLCRCLGFASGILVTVLLL